MCRRRLLWSVDPFTPYNHGLAPQVASVIGALRREYLSTNLDPVPAVLGKRPTHRRLALVALALRHLPIEEGGEAVDVTRRQRGRQLRGALMARVARRLGIGVPRAWALIRLITRPIDDAVAWAALDYTLMTPEQAWRAVEREELRQPGLSRLVQRACAAASIRDAGRTARSKDPDDRNPSTTTVVEARPPPPS